MTVNLTLQLPDRPQQSRLPPPVKPKITADSEAEREETEIATREDDMDTSDGAEISTERLQSTYHSSEMALVFERLVSPKRDRLFSLNSNLHLARSVTGSYSMQL